MAYVLLQIIILYFLLIQTDKNVKLVNVIIISLLVVFSGLRYGIGVDFHSYVDHFRTIINGYDSSLEFGLVFIGNLVGLVGGTPQLVFLISSIITIFLFSSFIKNHSYNYLLSWVVFISFGTFYLASFNLVKQYIAISIFAYSIKFIKEANFYKYVATIIAASLFHVSAVLLVPMYFLNKKLKIYHYAFILITFYFLINSLEIIISFTKYSIYLDEKWANSMNNNRNMVMTYIFIMLNVVVILTYKFIDNIKYSHIFANMAFISLLLITASLFVDYLPNMFFYRMNNYFMISYIVIVTFYIKKMNHSLRVISTLTLLLSMYAYFFLTLIYKGKEYLLIPYKMNFELF